MWFRYLLVILNGLWFLKSQLLQCQDDPNLELEDGPLDDHLFTWLGTLQYIHVKNGTPHYFRMPRVVLISRQFVLSTAVDAAKVPEGYALGNIAFGEYERDDEECELTIEKLREGFECEPAAIIVPIADVLLHPEYKHFGGLDSLALLKMITPIQSVYMLPVCLPLENYLTGKHGRPTDAEIWHIDYDIDVPRDIVEEDKDVTRLYQLPKELCYMYDGTTNDTSHGGKNRVICTTGCGLHSGAPIVIQERSGHWVIVALSQGGSPCRDPLRRRRPPSPPKHIVTYPYVPWITNAITGRTFGLHVKDDPFGFIMPRGSMLDQPSNDEGWSGHWWKAGLRCYDRGKLSADMFRFYHEIFQIKPKQEVATNFSYFLELNSGHRLPIVCIKVGVPYRAGPPRVWGLNEANVKVYVPLLNLRIVYKFQVEGWATTTMPVEDDAISNSSSGKSPEAFG